MTRGPRWRGCGRRACWPGLAPRLRAEGIDLGGADLSGVPRRDLRDVDLSDADLSDADLSGADLSGAYPRRVPPQRGPRRRVLRGADLSGAYLRDADLSGADLSGAYLHDADLSGADLSGAYLDALRWSSDPPVTGWTLRNGVPRARGVVVTADLDAIMERRRDDAVTADTCVRCETPFGDPRATVDLAAFLRTDEHAMLCAGCRSAAVREMEADLTADLTEPEPEEPAPMLRWTSTARRCGPCARCAAPTTPHASCGRGGV